MFKFTRKKITLALLGLLLGFGFIFSLFQFIAKGEPFDVASQFIRQNDNIRNVLGDIKQINLSFFGTSFHISGSSGDADYKIKVTGTKGSGIVYVYMTKTAGQWNIIKANLKYDKNLINLQTKIMSPNTSINPTQNSVGGFF